jgi:hypothetical protein
MGGYWGIEERQRRPWPPLAWITWPAVGNPAPLHTAEPWALLMAVSAKAQHQSEAAPLQD